MKLVYDKDNLIARNRTPLKDENGNLFCWGIYDFAFKYRTRIFNREDIEIAYIERNIAKENEPIEFFDPLGNKEDALIVKDDKIYLEKEGSFYEGDLEKGEIPGLLKIDHDVIEIINEERALKAIEVLFSLAEMERTEQK